LLAAGRGAIIVGKDCIINILKEPRRGEMIVEKWQNTSFYLFTFSISESKKGLAGIAFYHRIIIPVRGVIIVEKNA
jgi:hypothetical protein